jgi:hypothetical protein
MADEKTPYEQLVDQVVATPAEQPRIFWLGTPDEEPLDAEALRAYEAKLAEMNAALQAGGEPKP